MRKTCIAETNEHQKLINEGWKPIFAFQVLEYKKKYHKEKGYFQGFDLKPKTQLNVIMEKVDA